MPETSTPKPAAKKAAAAPSVAKVEHPNLAAALAAFQAEMPTVFKGQTARIPGKDGRQGYSYQYADLADVAKVAHPLLAKHGLAFSTAPQHLDGVGFVLRGTLRHTSGEVDQGVLPITGRSAQDLGSSLTYLRRYLLGCMTGIVTDDDEDGGLATEAGTERPQAETPEAVQPALRRDQQILADRVDALPQESRQKFIDWWAANNLPILPQTTAPQVTWVMEQMDKREQASEAEAAPDPS
jgi:hypothetical protein